MRLPQLMWYDEEEEQHEEGEELRNFPCYEFNQDLRKDMDDRYCIHCKKYLTLQCENLEMFLDDLED